MKEDKSASIDLTDADDELHPKDKPLVLAMRELLRAKHYKRVMEADHSNKADAERQARRALNQAEEDYRNAKKQLAKEMENEPIAE